MGLMYFTNATLSVLAFDRFEHICTVYGDFL